MKRALAMLVALPVLALASGPVRADSWTAEAAVTTVELDAKLLRALGLEVVVQGAGAPGRVPGDVFHSVPPSRLAFRAPRGDIETFDSGRLIHSGGFVLAGRAVTIHLDPLILQVAEGAAHDFDWVDATGRRWFVLRDKQFVASFERQELRLQNVSIHVAPEMADFLGDSRLADAFVGGAHVVLPALVPPGAGGSGAGDVCMETGGEIDVALTAISQVSQLAREPGVRVALAPSAKLENVGVGSVEWFEAIQPLEFGGVGPHPYLSMSLVRMDEDGTLVQLGLGDVKHAFFTVNTDCECPGSHILYPGCTDTYGVFTNRNRTYLAPREEVGAFLGSWERIGSHFDQCFGMGCTPGVDDADDYRSHLGIGHHDDFEHRVVVPEPELDVEGARYFVDAWYLTRDDVDVFNGMGHREVDPTLVGEVWTFPFLDAGLTNGSVLELQPRTDLQDVDTGEGRLQLAVHLADAAPGTTRFHYRLLNLDFDRQIDRFWVPRTSDVPITNVDSHGLGDDPANDWTVTVEADRIVWDAPPGTGLDWGMLQSFRFDATAPAAAGEVWVEARETGAQDTFAFQTVVVPEPGARSLVGCAILLLATLRRRGSRT